MFIDQARIYVKAGDGGNGCVSFRREKHVPRGGPDGGDGGDGGNVVFRVHPSLKTLLDFRYRQHYKAQRGEHGKGKKKHGKKGEDLIIWVPAGTVIRDVRTGGILADLIKVGDSKILAFGGKGGRGNARFATSTNQAPRYAERGTIGQKKVLDLELKLIADVGLVGLPNVGKSTLLSRVSSAHPKIADYPFTTLEPILGIVPLGEYDSFVMADIPGLIKGAHEGRGLGIQFLRHIERTRVLLFLIDSTSKDPFKDFHTLREELRLFNTALLRKPHVAVLTKIDLIRDRHSAANFNLTSDVPLLKISSITGEGIGELLRTIGEELKKATEGGS
ncbi:MAG TPA: GTPase ObgE [Candidatus Latescibacteria bacterium]|nr:GTPase ObgE [Candidatus Latescibacterota bacterium]